MDAGFVVTAAQVFPSAVEKGSRVLVVSTNRQGECVSGIALNGTGW